MRISDWSSDVCSSDLIEINPLAVTEDGKLMVLDAKVGFDSNAGFRHKDLAELRDETEEDPQELEASKYDLAYIKLGGYAGWRAGSLWLNGQLSYSQLGYDIDREVQLGPAIGSASCRDRWCKYV